MADQTETVAALQEGDMAPDFTLPAANGPASLSDYRGRNVVLYFYPADDTPGCTTEACEFRDLNAEMRQAGAVVLGVSPDPVESHRKFSDKYSLTFPLLSDEDHSVAHQYGVWQLKNNYGKSYWGVVRGTFLIGPDGRIRKIWRKVKAEGHAAEVLAAIEQTGLPEEAGLGSANFDKAN